MTANAGNDRKLRNTPRWESQGVISWFSFRNAETYAKFVVEIVGNPCRASPFPRRSQRLHQPKLALLDRTAAIVGQRSENKRPGLPRKD
jgi:hypothetical protein